MSFIALINDENMAFEGMLREPEGGFDVCFRGESMTVLVTGISEDELSSYVDADVVRCRLTVESDEAAGILEA